MELSDLSFIHKPINADFISSGIEAAGVSVEDEADFRKNGFLIGPRVLSDVQIDVLRSELAEMMTPENAADPLFYEYNLNESEDPSTVLFHCLGAWRAKPAFHDVIFLPSVIRIAEQLLEGPVRFWHDQLFVKPARDGAVVEWHQDYSYWTRTRPVAHLTCWIGLDDSNEDNGCVQYVPGSHKWELLPRFSLSGDMNAIRRYLNEEQEKAFSPVPAVLRAGEASFHHSMTVHGSYQNRSERPRRAIVLNFIRDGVVSDSDEPLLEGISPIPKGSKLDGRFFPLLSRFH